MTTFDKREEGFEKKFALDEEQKFKAEVRRNKLLGLWASENLEIPRCAIAHLRSGPSDHAGMTGLDPLAKFLTNYLHQSPRRRAEKTAAARYCHHIVARLEITHADRSDRPVAQFLRGIALRQQRDAEAGLDQPLLRGQAVDRRPVDFTQAKRLKQRKHM